MNTWFVAQNGQQSGPFSIDQLRGMAASGALTPETLVWAEGMPGWAAAGTTPLAQALSAPAAPPPPAFGGAPAYAAPAPAQAFGGAPATTFAAQGATGGAAPPRGFVEAIKVCFAKYVDFQGRASRSELWWFVLFYYIVLIVLGALFTALLGENGVWFLYVGLLVFFLPLLGVIVRRLHDTDRSGWWYLISLVPLVGFIVLIVFLCQRGTPGPNRFG